MRSATQRVGSVLCVLLGFATASAQARDSVLNAIPADAVAFAVVHNMGDTNRSIGEVAKLVHAPIPDLLSLAKGATGMQKGLDEQGDLALVLTAIEPAPRHVVLVPVSNFADFFAAIHVKEPESGVAEFQLVGMPAVVGRKGNYAVISSAKDRESVEKFLASKSERPADESLSTWVDSNRVSLVVSSTGIQQLLPKLIAGLRIAQAQIGQAGIQNGQSAAAAMNMYVDLFDAAQTEVDQFGIGLRIDSAQTVDLASRVQLMPEGKWAKAIADVKPAEEDLLGGLQAGPFAFAAGGIVPQEAMGKLMKVSVQMMQSNPGFKMSPEEAQKFGDLSMEAMKGVRSVRMRMGISQPGAGIYGSTSAVTSVDDSKRFLDGYEKSLEAIRKLAEGSKDSAIPVGTTRHITVDGIDVLEVSMDVGSLKITQQGAGDQKKLMQLFFGPDEKLKTYVAPVDEHTIVMAYTSLDNLKSAIESFKSKKPGLSADEGLAKVAAALPPGSQVVAFVNPSGVAKIVHQVTTTEIGENAPRMPELPDSPPIGMASKFSKSGVEGHLVVTAKTLQAIGDTLRKARGASVVPPVEQQ